MFARTSTSAYFFASAFAPTNEPIQPAKKPSGTDTIAGLVRGNKGVPVRIAVPSGFQIFGLTATRTNAVIKPVNIAAIAPVVLNFL